MRSSSRGALAQLVSTWEGALRTLGLSGLTVARELFGVRDTLDRSGALSRSLEDASREPEARAELARTVFERVVSPEVLDVVTGAAREKWADDGDIALAIETLAVESILIEAEREGHLGRVEQELYSAMRLLKEHRALRLALHGEKTLEARMDLVKDVLVTALPETVALVQRSLVHVGETSIVRSLSDYIEKAAARGDHLAASVIASAPLTEAQRERLQASLSRKYGKDVTLHVTLDPEILGGMRIHIGDDVIDGTIQHRLDVLRQTFARHS